MRSDRLVPFATLVPLALALLAAAAPAQRVFIIDAQNRPGTHFTDLPPAEVAAQDGDILDVRADGGSVYTAITTSKALTILGNMAVIRVTAAQPFRVVGLAAGRAFVLQRCTMFHNQLPATPLVELVNCAGRVHLEQVDLSNYSGQAGVDAVACAAVTVRESRLLAGTPALRARNSTLVVSSGQMVGSGASALLALPASPAISLQDSSLFLAGTRVTGGLGGGPTLPPAPAMILAGSTVTVGGGAMGARLTAGSYGTAGGTASVAAVSGQTSLVRIDASVPVQPTGTGQPFQGVTAVTSIVPAFALTGQLNVALAFQGNAAAANATLWGAPANPVYSPSFAGSLWLAPATIVAWPGVLRGFGTWALPKGTTLAIQIASVVGGGVELSNPGVVTAR